MDLFYMSLLLYKKKFLRTYDCGGSVVERQATNPVVPSSNPGQSLQYQKISWVL